MPCPYCGDVPLPASSLVLRYGIELDEWTARFECSACGVLSVAPVGRTAVPALVRSGAPTEVWTLPAELDERPEGGARLTTDDAVAFERELATPGWFERLATSTARRAHPSQRDRS